MLFTAIICQVDMPDAPIVFILLPINKSLLLQQINGPRNHRLIQIQHTGQFVLFGSLIIKNTNQHNIFRESQIQFLTRLYDKQLRAPMQD